MTTIVWDRSNPNEPFSKLLDRGYSPDVVQIRLFANINETNDHYTRNDQNGLTLKQRFLEKVEPFKETWESKIIDIMGSNYKGTTLYKKGRISSEKDSQVMNAHDEFLNKLRITAKKMNNVAGKWLMFTTTEYRDSIWKALSNSFVTGRLSKLSQCCQVKIMIENSARTGFCIYCEDSYNKGEVEEVWRELVKDDLFPEYYKCDALTNLKFYSGNVYSLKLSEYSYLNYITKEKLAQLRAEATTRRTTTSLAKSGFVPMTVQEVTFHEFGKFSVQPPAPQQEFFG